MVSPKDLTTYLFKTNEYQAIKQIKASVSKIFEIEQMVLFGSVARGEADEESDIDLLIVTKQFLKRQERHRITDAVCDLNLEYKTNFSTLVVDSGTWHSQAMPFLSIYQEIQREGILV